MSDLLQSFTVDALQILTTTLCLCGWRLQRGLDPRDKAVWVNNYVEKIRYGVGIIAHSCGVHHPRALKRFYCRIVQPNVRSVTTNVLYPPQQVIARYHVSARARALLDGVRVARYKGA